MSALVLSAPTLTIASVKRLNPWRRLGRLAHIDLIWHSPEVSIDYGITDFEAGTISLRRDLDQAGRRSTVLHECLHVERGPALDEPVLYAREELRVRREAARLLLPDIRAVGEALAWAHTTTEAADELWVDEDTLLDRLEHLHPAELHYLRRRLDHAEVE